MELFILIAGHFFADFDVQSRFVAEGKGKRKILMLAHCMSYTFVMTLAFWFVGIKSDAIPITIFFSHIPMDYWKAAILPSLPQCKNVDGLGWPLYIDQIYHIGVIVLLCGFVR